MVVIETKEFSEIPKGLSFYALFIKPEERYKERFGVEPEIAYHFRDAYWMVTPESMALVEELKQNENIAIQDGLEYN